MSAKERMDFEVDVSDIRLIVNRILDHIERDLGISAVRIDQDSYWEVLDGERYDFSKSPESFGHGQLIDDWKFLLPILQSKDAAVSLMLVHVAPLLRRIGEQVGQ